VSNNPNNPITLFAYNQPAVFFSHTKSASATSHSQPAVLFSHNKLASATSHSQPNRVIKTQGSGARRQHCSFVIHIQQYMEPNSTIHEKE